MKTSGPNTSILYLLVITSIFNERQQCCSFDSLQNKMLARGIDDPWPFILVSACLDSCLHPAFTAII